MDRSGSPPSDMLCFAIYAASHAFNRAYRSRLAPHGLTYPQYLVMLLLWAGDGRSVGELGRALFLDSGTLTPLLHRLDAAGLTRRARDGTDERQVRIWLTERGAALQDGLAGVPASIGCAVGLGDAEVRSLTSRIAELGATLRNTDGGAGKAGDRDE